MGFYKVKSNHNRALWKKVQGLIVSTDGVPDAKSNLVGTIKGKETNNERYEPRKVNLLYRKRLEGRKALHPKIRSLPIIFGSS